MNSPIVSLTGFIAQRMFGPKTANKKDDVSAIFVLNFWFISKNMIITANDAINCGRNLNKRSVSMPVNKDVSAIIKCNTGYLE